MTPLHTEGDEVPASGGLGYSRAAAEFGAETPGAAAARLTNTERWAGAGRVATLAVSDTMALLLAGTTAFLLWASPVHGQSAALYLPAAPLAILIVLAYGQAGLYPGFGLGPVEALRRYWVVTATAFLVLAALVLLLKLENVYSRLTLTLAFTLSLILVPLLRRSTLRLVRRWSWWQEPVVLIGRGRRSDLAREMLVRHPAEFRAVGAITIGESGSSGRRMPPDVLHETERFAQAGVRIAFADIEGPGADEFLDRLMFVFPRVIILREFDELPVEGVSVRNLGGVLGLEYGSNLLRRQSRWVKRSLDIGLGVLLLVVTFPVTLGCMIAVKLLSAGPALFWQTREGRKGRPVRVPKIRTMVPDAEHRMEELFLTDAGLREEWKSAFKLKRDPRIIPVVGKLFRRFSIDELPQLWSVVKGDMSLVGPRPFPDYHLDALTPQARQLRNEVRPGITGLWQVTARGTAGVEAQQSHDIYYIRNWSPWLDLYILARTISVVISGRGAY